VAAPIVENVHRDFGGVQALLHPSGFGFLLHPNPALDVEYPGSWVSLHHAAMRWLAELGSEVRDDVGPVHVDDTGSTLLVCPIGFGSRGVGVKGTLAILSPCVGTGLWAGALSCSLTQPRQTGPLGLEACCKLWPATSRSLDRSARSSDQLARGASCPLTGGETVSVWVKRGLGGKNLT